jgi:hypothetical protein
MKLDESKKIPFGKYQGKTVGWLLNTDKGYCKWLTKEDLWTQWDLYKSESKTGTVKKKKEYSTPKADTGPIKGTINYDPKDPPPWDEPQAQQVTEEFVRDNGEVIVSIKEKAVDPKDNRWIEDVKILLELIHKQKETAPQIKQQIEELLYLPVEN